METEVRLRFLLLFDLRLIPFPRLLYRKEVPTNLREAWGYCRLSVPIFNVFVLSVGTIGAVYLIGTPRGT